jgi:DNA-binding response OmpR family regulator
MTQAIDAKRVSSRVHIGSRFSEVLLSQALINQRDLNIAGTHAEHQHVSLVDAVVELGFVSELESYAALAAATGLLIVDLMMPGMDGYQVIEHIRQDISLATLPVMVLTAEEGPAIEERVLELGADDYLVKPFEPPVLLSRVRAAFRRIERATVAV